MTMHQTEYHDRIETFKAQMIPSQEYHAISTSNFGNNACAGYRVTAKNGLEFTVSLFEVYTRIKCFVMSEGKEVEIEVHPGKLIEGLDAIQKFFVAVQPLQGRLETEAA